ncbi:MAG: LysR substrate-binding domain-containing protein [Pseudomonadota bacterium]|nr:LysR substrate-binding domain-containing protein [Pseudomonadota bacterium]
MELSDLRIFSAVVREGGMTRAAERLGRVQSNVTTRIRQLEEDVGVKLFGRDGRKLILTPAGQILLDYADRLLAMADDARLALRDGRPQGQFRLGAMESTAAVRLPKPIAAYAQRYPDVVLELRTGNPVQLSTAVHAGDIDAALIAEPVAAAKFDSVVAFNEEIFIVTSKEHPPIGEGRDVPRNMIVFEHGCPHRKRLEQWYTARKELPERTIEIGSYHAMFGSVLAGMGAALVPRSVISTFPEMKRLRINRLSKGESQLRTMLIWRKGRPSPNVEALVRILTK